MSEMVFEVSQLQQAVMSLVAVFYKYSGIEGDPSTLTKGELKIMLQNELGKLLGKASDKAAVDKIFNDLDTNKDGTVDFLEYIKLVGCCTMCCNECVMELVNQCQQTANSGPAERSFM